LWHSFISFSGATGDLKSASTFFCFIPGIDHFSKDLSSFKKEMILKTNLVN
jgi:hypothetical protein